MFTRLVIRVVVFDAGLALPLIVVWTKVLGLADLGVVLVLGGVRIAVLIAHVAFLLMPLRDWQAQDRALGERELLEVDDTLGSIHTRFVVGYVTGWLLVDLLSLVLARIGVPLVLPLGPAELLVATLVALAFAIGTTPLMSQMFRQGLAGVEREIATQLVERHLDQRRARSSFATGIMTMAACSSLALLVGLTAVIVAVRVEGVRNVAIVEVEQRALLAAIRVRAGESVAEDGLTLVERRPDETGAMVTGYDRQQARARAAVAIADGRWVVAESDVDEQLGWPLLWMVGLAPFIVLPAQWVSRTRFRAQSGALRRITATARAVVETGQIRGLDRIVPLHNDEIGGLAREFNGMLDVLDELAAAATSVAAGDLRVRLERPGELHDAFRGMLEHLHEMVVQIRGTALELAAAAAEIHAITTEQECAVEAQSESVGEVGATITWLASSAAGIADTAKGVLGNAEHSLDTTDVMAEKIAELSRQTTSIGELLDLVEDIAERSDLLALNGSLEATRVGELGRGFAIVAAEMRRLAERVTGTIVDVRMRVADIRAAGASTVMVTDDSRKLAQRSADAARQISTVTHQQSHETAAVAVAIHEVTNAVIALAGATAQARQASLGLRGRAERLEQLTRQFTLRKPIELAKVKKS